MPRKNQAQEPSSDDASDVDEQVVEQYVEQPVRMSASDSQLVSSLRDDPFANLQTFAFVCRYNGSHPADQIGNIVGRCNDPAFTSLVMSFFAENPRDATRDDEAKDKIWDRFLAKCGATTTPISPWTRHLELATLQLGQGEGHREFIRRFRQAASDIDCDHLLMALFVSAFRNAGFTRYALDRRPGNLAESFDTAHVYFTAQKSAARASSNARQATQPAAKRPKQHGPGGRSRFRRPKIAPTPSRGPCGRCGRRNHDRAECRARYHANGRPIDGQPPVPGRARTNVAAIAPSSSGVELHAPVPPPQGRLTPAAQLPSMSGVELHYSVPPPPPPRGSGVGVRTSVPPPPPLPPGKKREEPTRGAGPRTQQPEKIEIAKVQDVMFDREGRVVSVASVNALTATDSLIRTTVTIDGEEVEAMVDTGAERSLCARRRFRKRAVTGHKLLLSLADGRTAAIKWFMHCSVTWENQTHHLCIPAVDGLGYDLLLGMDWLKLVDPDLNFAEGTVTPKCKSNELVDDLISRYEQVFGELTHLPPSRGHLDLDIPLVVGSVPPRHRVYRLNSHQQLTLQQAITDLQERRWIQPSKSPWISPLLFVKKKDGTLRMCVDFRGLNACTVPDRYPLPLLHALVHAASGHSFFSCLDLKSAYHQVKMKDEARHLTSFFAPGFGQFEWCVMPFGIANAPARYQRVMDEVLQPMAKRDVSCYLDDILIHTSNGLQHHLQKVEQVLALLQDNSLHLNKDKCEFAKTSVEWLGHTISREGHRPIKAQLANVLNWPIPKTAHELRRFLGAVNYYSKYIEGFSKYVQPLFRHVAKTKKSSRKKLTDWSEADSNIFNSLKVTLCNLPTLCPILDLPSSEGLDLYTDASDKAIGAVLQHQGRPIEFFSATLSTHEIRWPVRQKELYAVIRALQHWRYLCVGRPITVYTDHKSLETVMAQSKIQEARIQRWTFILSEFDLTFTYIPGDKNVVADALSRVFLVRELREDDQLYFPWSAYTKDPYWGTVVAKLEEYPQYRKLGEVLYYDKRICVPSSHQVKAIALSHDSPSSGHQGAIKTQQRLARHFYWPGLYADVREYVSTCHICAMAKAGRKLRVPTQPLPVAPYPWHTVTMDLIVGLPTTAQGFDAIYVFVDKFSKMVHLAATSSTVSAEGCVDLFLQNIYRLHGLPEVLISDRDPRFTSKLFRAVMRQFNVHMKMSTSGHAQTDGQTERANRVIGNMLRSYTKTNETLWVEYLPTIEFAINSSPAASTKLTPFEVCSGLAPRQIGFPTRLQDDTRVLPDDLMDRIATFQRNASAQLELAYESASPGAVTPPLQGGDEVYVSTHLFKDSATKARKNKLTHPFRGPFRIKEVLGPAHYRVDLSSSEVRIHDVINIKFLKRVNQVRGASRPGPIPGHEPDEFTMERILGHKKIRGSTYYLVKWEGYPEYEATYEPTRHFLGGTAKQLLAEYRLELARSEAQKRRRE